MTGDCSQQAPWRFFCSVDSRIVNDLESSDQSELRIRPSDCDPHNRTKIGRLKQSCLLAVGRAWRTLWSESRTHRNNNFVLASSCHRDVMTVAVVHHPPAA